MDAATAQSAPTPSVADDTIRIIEQDILKDFSVPTEPAPEKDEPSADSLFSTDFKLNLDELKFGRNYSGEN